MKTKTTKTTKAASKRSKIIKAKQSSTADRRVRPVHKLLARHLSFPQLSHDFGREFELMAEIAELKKNQVNINIDENTVINMAGKIKDAENNYDSLLTSLNGSAYNYTVKTTDDNRRRILLLLPDMHLEFFNDGTYKVQGYAY